MNIYDEQGKIKSIKDMTNEEKEFYRFMNLKCLRLGKITLYQYMLLKYSSLMTCEEDADQMELKLLTDIYMGPDPLEHPELFPGTEGWTEEDFDNLCSKK